MNRKLPTVTFSGQVLEQLPPKVIEQPKIELPIVFATIESDNAESIFVPRLFSGYHPDYRQMFRPLRTIWTNNRGNLSGNGTPR